MFVCWGGGGSGWGWYGCLHVGLGWVLTCIVGFNSLFTGRLASNLEGGLFTQKYHVLLKENIF